jgi:hypothetical protein
LVECRVLEPVREDVQYSRLFIPERIADSSAATLARYILNHKDQVLLARALGALWYKRQQCLEQAIEGELSMQGYLPVDPTLRRVRAADAYYEMWLELPARAVMQPLWY